MKVSTSIKNICLALSLSSITPLLALASPIDVAVCNDCSESQQIRAAEREGRGWGYNQVIVVDIIHESSRKFSVINDEDRHGEPTTNTYQVAMTNDEIHDVRAVYDYRRELINVIKRAEQKGQIQFPSAQRSAASKNNDDTNFYYMGEVPAKGNPYDFIRTTMIKNDLYDYHFAGDTGLLTQIVSSSFNKIKIPKMNDLGVKLTIQFYSDSLGQVKNGSVEVAIDLNRKRFDVLSARDVDNNSVPIKKSQVNGHDFGFATGDRQNTFNTYIEHMFSSGGCTFKKGEKLGNRYIFTYSCR